MLLQQAIGFLNDLFKRAGEGKTPVIARSVALKHGLVNRFGPQWIDDGALSEAYNVDLSDPTQPMIRDGYVTIGSGQTDIDAGSLSKRINSLGVLSPTGTTATMLIATIPDGGNGETYFTSDTTTGWDKCQTSAPAEYDPGAGVDIPTAQLDDCYYVLGSTPAAIATGGLVTISTNTDDVALTGGSPPHNGADIAYFLGRGWILDTNCYLAYSKFQPAASTINTDWARTGTLSDTTLAGRLQLSPNAAQVARGLLPWNKSYLLAFFDSSIEAVFLGASPVAGSVPGITDPFSYAQREVVEPRFGLIGRRAKASLGSEVYFMDQYGQVRTLTQTINGTQAGVASLPLSEPVAAELPGRLNFAQAAKVHFVIRNNKLFIYYPRDSNSECYHRLVYNLAYRFWESVDTLAHPHGCSVVSDVRGNGSNGFEVFTSNGNSTSPTAKVYRHDGETYADDGTAITYTEITRGFGSDTPEAPKLFLDFELDGVADAGVRANVALQVDENGRFPQHSADWTGAASAGSFPLVTATFPLTGADFPLIASSKVLRRKVFSWRELNSANLRRGRFGRFKITCTPGAGKTWRRSGYRLTYKQEAVDWTRTD